MSLQRIRKQIKEACLRAHRKVNTVQLVCVTKKQPIEAIQTLYDQGERIFGESRIQEALPKQQAMNRDIQWHLIGSLQTNKVKKAVGAFELIHSVDSFHLAEAIHKEAQKKGITQNILLEVNTSQEASKHGFQQEELLDCFDTLLELSNLRIQGLMTMAPAYTAKSEEEQQEKEQQYIRSCFRSLATLKQQLIAAHPEIHTSCIHLSMGMSQDFEIAIEEGATFIRIGSALF
jgi:pyridoxal phosphate enzyme (YggS family)